MDDDIPEGASLEAPVKFFNRAKGFGFVTLPDGQDVFFHVSSLTPLGLTAVDQGDVLVCEVGDVPRGRQVTRILEVKHGAAPIPEGGDRPPRRDFGDRPPRREFGGGGGFGGGMGDRPPRREFGARPFTPDGPSEIVAGTVKFFDVRKGFGFIVPDAGGKDVFVHITAVQAAGLQGLNEGQKVSYEVSMERGKAAAGMLRAL